ncbi:MAG: hypothetical protein ACOZNI_16060 [Myxococcota bacterium]
MPLTLDHDGVATAGEVRLLGSLPPELVLDTEGHTLGQDFVLDSRLRLGLAGRLKGWRLSTEWDLFDGQLAGDPWDVRGEEDARDRQQVGVTDADSFSARRLAVDGKAGPVGIEAGLVTSHWGLGMVANDGAHDPVFGRADFGDRVIRLRLATRPAEKSPLVFVLAGDRVVEDDTADWGPLAGGEEAWQGIASVLWAEERRKLGLYGVYRHQVEADGERTTDVGVLDLYGDATLGTGDATLRVALEGAGILGRTDRAQSYNARDGLAVASAGVTGLAEARHAKSPGRVLLRAGWASGDGDPDDGASNAFAFDRDFDAGMVLFDEVQGAVDAATYAQLTDPAHSGGAPDGAEALVGEGALRGATFVQPVLGVNPTKWLDVNAGTTLAWSTAPISQSFATYRNGGVPANHLGEPTSGYWLGAELDWAVTVGDAELKTRGVTTRPALLVQGGHLIASADLGGGVHTLVTATGRLRW